MMQRSADRTLFALRKMRRKDPCPAAFQALFGLQPPCFRCFILRKAFEIYILPVRQLLQAFLPSVEAAPKKLLRLLQPFFKTLFPVPQRNQPFWLILVLFYKRFIFDNALF